MDRTLALVFSKIGIGARIKKVDICQVWIASLVDRIGAFTYFKLRCSRFNLSELIMFAEDCITFLSQ